MKKILVVLVALFAVLLPSIVRAETKSEDLKTIVAEEITKFEGSDGYKTYVDTLKDAKLSKFKNTDDKVNVYVFHGLGCSHCLEAVTHFATIAQTDLGKKFNFIGYETWNNSENSALLDKVFDYFNESTNNRGVPLIVIGDKHFVGYSSRMDSEIEEAINTEYSKDAADRFIVLNNLDQQKNTNNSGSNSSKSSNASTVVLVIIVIAVAVCFMFVVSKSK